MTQITVVKLDIHGRETWRYHGQLLKQDSDAIVLEAFFDRQDMMLSGMTLQKGDRFLETWYYNRWYNIFEIHSREDGSLRGWYCNIGRPAQMVGQTLSYVDLALDLLVFPGGKQVVLDEDEFTQLALSGEDRESARAALSELKELFRERLQN